MSTTATSKFFIILNDLIVNIFLLFLCMFLIIQVSGYPDMARSFPLLILIFMLLLIFLDTISTIFIKRKKDQSENDMDTTEKKDAASKDLKPDGIATSNHQASILFTILLMFFFLLLIHLIGFTFGTLIFAFLSARYLGYRKIKGLLLSSILITAFMHLIFVVIMNSYLPQGLLIELFSKVNNG